LSFDVHTICCISNLSQNLFASPINPIGETLNPP